MKTEDFSEDNDESTEDVSSGRATVQPFSGPACLLLFTKLPGLTPCKTRLFHSTPLTEKETETLARAFIADSLRAARTSTQGRLIVASHPYCNIHDLEEILSDLPCPLQPQLYKSLEIIEQYGRTFGERLQNTIDTVHSQSSQGVVVIGTDSPTLSPHTITEALEYTAQGEFVLGPASHGGLYLIGLPGQALHQGFRLIDAFSHPDKTELEWFTQQVEAIHGDLTLLQPHFDVDVKDDLITLLALLPAVSLAYARTPEQQQSELSFDSAPTTWEVLSSLGLGLRKQPSDNRSLMLVRKK